MPKQKKKPTKGEKTTGGRVQPVSPDDAIRRFSKRNKVIKRIQSKFKKRKTLLSLNQPFVKELHRYLKEPVVIPKKLDATNKKSVERIQESLAEVDAWQSRVALIQFDIAKVQQVLNRLETLLYTELVDSGFIQVSTTGPKQKVILSSACPTLQVAKTIWSDFETLCTIVNNRLSESKRTVHMQTKLDDNARWASKVSP